MFRPLIGVLPGYDPVRHRYSIHQGCMDGVSAVGGLPALLPVTADEGLLAAYISRFDGFLFSGGGDIDPAYFGEKPIPGLGEVNVERDACEIPLARLLAGRKDKPVLAICRGCQVLNVALGGSLYQDLPSQMPGALRHRQAEEEDQPSHSVAIRTESLLFRVTGQAELRVNSLHHQAVKTPGAGMTVSALAPDGVAEAVELAGHPFYLGVQWHPERMWEHDPPSLALFRALVRAAGGGPER
ncbi:MAG: gamma-glutamyl-gamma-aminobutyrate hydrolase family protein [Clostridia bacterium]|nr:gamma-glutamyl-gamma-aminobutyrate hydrolase family protein [Clostridia bacterium]